MQTEQPTLSRRELAQALLAAAAATQLSACSEPGGKAGAPTGKKLDVIRQALEALKASPDHLQARAAAAVATRDPNKIAAFVQESLTVLPSVSNAPATVTPLWGAFATLRCGAGSARDRAEVLAQLLRDAGCKTSVMSMARPASLTADELYRRRDLAFAPDMKLLAPLLAHRKSNPPLDTAPDQQTAREVERLAQSLLVALPKDGLARATAANMELPDRLPIVEFERNGRKAWAVAYGNTGILNEAPAGLAAASDPTASKISLAVSVALNPPPGSTIARDTAHEVLRAEWPLEAVAGRQALLGFIPPGGPEPYLRGADPYSVPGRIPVVRLQAAGTGVQGNVAGTRLTIDGQVAPPVLAEKAPVPGARRSDIARLTATVSAAAFPNIEIDLQVADANGKPVDGLNAADFQIAENGKRQTISVLRDAVPEGIRILVLYDTSGSVTESWGSTSARSAFEARFADEMVAAAKSAPFLIQVVGLNGAPSPTGWAAPDAAKLRATLASISSLSDVWRSLGETMPQSGASAAIMVSDMASSLELPTNIADYQRTLRATHVPLALVPIGRPDQAAIATLKTLAQPQEFAQQDPQLAQKLGAFVAGQVKQAASVNYRLRYRALEAGSSTRQVLVSLPGRPEPSSAAHYTVPPAAERVAPSGVAGVYLSLNVAGRTTTRRLGGVSVNYRGTVADTANAEAIEEATAVLNGLHNIAFEPAEPTVSAILFEGLSRLLALEPFLQSPQRPAVEMMNELAHVLRFDPTGALLLERVPGSAAGMEGAVPDGLRVVITSDLAGGGAIERKVDIVPAFNTWRGLSKDPKLAFKAALRHSLASSVREGQYFADSAARHMAGHSYLGLAPLERAEGRSGLSATQRAMLHSLADDHENRIRVLPSPSDVAAFWSIDPSSGAATAINADGRGGGGCSLPDNGYAFLISALALLGVACFAGDFAPGTPGWVACVGADAYSAGAAAQESFTNPAKIPALAATTGLYGAQLIGGTLVNIGGADKMLARGIAAVLLAMISVISELCG